MCSAEGPKINHLHFPCDISRLSFVATVPDSSRGALRIACLVSGVTALEMSRRIRLQHRIRS